MLKLNNVPTSVECKVAGRIVPVDLGLATGLEYLVAYELQGRIAGPLNPGYDVYDSALYPGLTFQVKHTAKERRVKNGQTVYSWVGNINCQADYYVLFAVKGEELLPFLFPCAVWEKTGHVQDRGGPIGKMKIRRFRIPTPLFCGRGRYGGYIYQSPLWNYHISDWPEGLHRRLNDYQQLSFQLAT